MLHLQVQFYLKYHDGNVIAKLSFDLSWKHDFNENF